MENNNEGDSSASTEVETTQSGVFDVNALAAHLRRGDAPISEEPEEQQDQQEESSEISEQTEVAEQAEELNDTESQNQDSEVEAEIEEIEKEIEEEEAENVLSKRDKALNKLRNRNKKLTKNWRTAEEKIEALEQEVNDLKQSSSSTAQKPEGLVHKVQNAESVEDLIQIKETAEAVSANVEEMLDEMIDNGDSEIEYNGKTFSRADLRNAKKEADEVLKTHIGEKANLFEQRAQYDEGAKADFEFISQPDSEEFKFIEEVMAIPEWNKFLNGRPEQFYFLGLLAEGKKSLQARRSEQQSSEEKGKTEEPQKKVGSTQKIAPSVSGLNKGVAPARASGDQIAQNKRKEILSRNRLDTTDLAQLIAASKSKT